MAVPVKGGSPTTAVKSPVTTTNSAPSRAGLGGTLSTITSYRVVNTPLQFLISILVLLRIMKKKANPQELAYKVYYHPVWKVGFKHGFLATEQDAMTTYKGYEKRPLTTAEIAAAKK